MSVLLLALCGGLLLLALLGGGLVLLKLGVLGHYALKPDEPKEEGGEYGLEQSHQIDDGAE